MTEPNNSHAPPAGVRQVGIWMPVELRDRLRHHVIRANTTMSELVRQLVERELAMREKR